MLEWNDIGIKAPEDLVRAINSMTTAHDLMVLTKAMAQRFGDASTISFLIKAAWMLKIESIKAKHIIETLVDYCMEECGPTCRGVPEALEYLKNQS